MTTNVHLEVLGEKNKAVYTTISVAGGWAGAIMIWAGAIIILAGSVLIWAGAYKLSYP